jgi:hypothetical protein
MLHMLIAVAISLVLGGSLGAVVGYKYGGKAVAKAQEEMGKVAGVKH